MERRQFTREFKLEAVRLIKSAASHMRRRQKILGFIRRNCAIG